MFINSCLCALPTQLPVGLCTWLFEAETLPRTWGILSETWLTGQWTPGLHLFCPPDARITNIATPVLYHEF